MQPIEITSKMKWDLQVLLLIWMIEALPQFVSYLKLIGAISSIFLLIRSLATIAFYDSTPLGRILTRDLKLVDLDVAFSCLFVVAATSNCYANLAVLAIVTWQVLFVSIPMIYFATSLQCYCWTRDHKDSD